MSTIYAYDELGVDRTIRKFRIVALEAARCLPVTAFLTNRKPVARPTSKKKGLE